MTPHGLAGSLSSGLTTEGVLEVNLSILQSTSIPVPGVQVDFNKSSGSLKFERLDRNFLTGFATRIKQIASEYQIPARVEF